MFNKKMKYVVKSVSMENPQALQDMLDEMTNDGWELYSLQEDEDEDSNLICHCIFMKQADNLTANSDVINISSFKSRMEKMLSPEQSPYDVCVDIQSKIRELKIKISKIKKELEGEAPASLNRKKLNDKISAGLKELDSLKNSLTQATSPDTMFSKLHKEKLSIQLSEELLGYIDTDSDFVDDELIAQTVKSRLKLTEKLGYVIPKIVFQDNSTINPYEFCINIRGLSVFNAFVYPNYLMFYEDELNLDKKIKNSIKDIDKLSGRKVVWIEKDKTRDFWCTGISGTEYIAKALEHCVVKYVDELLDYEELEKYLDVVRESNEFLVDNIVPDALSYADVKSLLVNLIREKVSIKDIKYIFEKLNDYSSFVEKDELLDRIRIALSKHICLDYMNDDGVISAFEFTDETLIKLAPLIYQEDTDVDDMNLDDDIVVPDMEDFEKVVEKLQRQVKKLNVDKPIVVVPLEFRTLTFAILNKFMDITVLAREEVVRNARLDVIAKI